MEASVTFLLENLKNIVLYHLTLTSTVKHELTLLEVELDRMKIFLQTLNRRINDPVFQHWEKEIREVICEVEDTIDTYVVSKAADQNRSMTSRFLKKLRPSLLSIEEQVKSLRESKVIPVFNKAKTELANLPVADASQTFPDETRDKRRKDPRQDNVVGFEDETDTLISYLKEDSDKLEVDSIIGMPGLGKTTVAWKIYQDPRIKFEFPTLIWIYVSQVFNKKDVLLTILKKFVRKDMSNCSVPELARRVKKHLERGKFLIFMDDVWSNDVWNEIKDFLPMSNRMGKVLITSRNESVAQHANTGREPHRLRFLTPEESWELLQLEVKLEMMNKSLEKTGRLIATQCEGLPLSIIVIGGILVDRCSLSGGLSALEREWKRVCESVKTNLIQDKEKLVENIISLSYTSLPYGLRDCFLYLGMFPEDPEIPAWKLIHLWIAEGFIQKRPDRSVEEVAQDNLKDLINRNLVMVGKSKPDGEVKTCRIHDTIREFCKNEAKYEKQNLFQEIKMSKEGVFEPPPENFEKFRRICIHSYVHNFLVKKPKVPKARSFLCFSKEPIVLENADIASITDAFSLLRVFDANTLKFPKYPAKITQLIHLRYLTLSAHDFHILPDAITNLWNLQTLIVDTSLRTLEIKANIWQMMHLRHLKTKASVILVKDGGNGTGGEKLQTLGKLSPQSCTVDVFKKANNLTTLAIRGDLLLLLESECMESLIRLNKLKLVNDAFPKVASENPLRGLPQPNRFPPMLKTLILSGTFLDWQHMFVIAQLHTLEALKLKNNAFMGNSWDVFVGGFHNLEFFYIERTNLMYWEAKTDAFPKLRSLVLKNCEKLQVVPFELKETLEMLSMERVTPYAVTSARKIESAKQQQTPEQQRGQRGVFKLLIAPGDQIPNY